MVIYFRPLVFIYLVLRFGSNGPVSNLLVWWEVGAGFHSMSRSAKAADCRNCQILRQVRDKFEIQASVPYFNSNVGLKSGDGGEIFVPYLPPVMKK